MEKILLTEEVKSMQNKIRKEVKDREKTFKLTSFDSIK